MKSVRFHDAAREELIHETLYYKAVSTQLGQRSAAAVEHAAQLAAEFPAMGSAYKYGTRRYFPKKFPFSLVYVEGEAEIYILALAPDSRSLATGAREGMMANATSGVTIRTDGPAHCSRR